MRTVLPALRYIAIALGDEAPAVAGRLIALAIALSATLILVIQRI